MNWPDILLVAGLLLGALAWLLLRAFRRRRSSSGGCPSPCPHCADTTRTLKPPGSQKATH